MAHFVDVVTQGSVSRVQYAVALLPMFSPVIWSKGNENKLLFSREKTPCKFFYIQTTMHMNT